MQKRPTISAGCDQQGSTNFLVLLLVVLAVVPWLIPPLSVPWRLFLTICPITCLQLVRLADAKHREGVQRIDTLKGELKVLGTQVADLNDKRGIWEQSELDSQRKAEEIEMEVDALLSALEKSEATSKVKGEFLAKLSREIHNSMDEIFRVAHELEDSPLTETQKGRVQTINTKAGVLFGVVRDILDFSTLEYGMLTLRSEEFNLLDELEQLSLVLKITVEKHGLEFVLECDNRLPTVVVGDAERLMQVLTRLSLIACDAVGPGGAVMLAVQADSVTEQTAVVGFTVGVVSADEEVVDDGSVYRSFCQSDVASTQQFSGEGFGVAIVSSLVSKMGGVLRTCSEMGGGIEYQFSASFAVSSQNDQRGHSTVECEAPSIRILLAEDNWINRKIAVTLLERRNYIVEVAGNGREAIDLYRENSFDLILMDIQMPEIGGVDATLEIRRIEQTRGGRIPIIALTANASAEDTAQYLEAGMNGHVSKPIEREKLFLAIESVVGR